MFKTVLNALIKWFVTSSENPSKMSLTLKGIIVIAIPWIVTLAGVFHITIMSADLVNLGNSLIGLAQATILAIGLAMTCYGFIRKIINTLFIPWPTDPTVISSIGTPKNGSI